MCKQIRENFRLLIFHYRLRYDNEMNLIVHDVFIIFSSLNLLINKKQFSNVLFKAIFIKLIKLKINIYYIFINIIFQEIHLIN